MAIKSDNTRGNPYHDERTGEFTEKNGGSISLAPKVTSDGKPRYFFSDLDDKSKIELFDSYYSKHGEETHAISELAVKYNTMKNNSPERQILREQILQDELKSQLGFPKKAERKATIVLGLPGSGKSTIATPIMRRDGAFVIDADNFKNRIPEFKKDPMMVSAVHEESTMLSNEMLNRLMPDGYNLVIGKVGGDIESIEYLLKELNNSGYKINIALNDLPIDKAIDRTIGRYERGESKRLVPLSALLLADKNVFDVFDKALTYPGVISGSVYSNDVPRGSQPILLKQYERRE